MQEQLLDDEKTLDKLLHGRNFHGKGNWYDFEQAWFEKHGGQLSDETKEFFTKLLQTPRTEKYLKHITKEDEGFPYIYSVYSEYIHTGFARPRDDLLSDLGFKGEFGTVFNIPTPYFTEGQKTLAPEMTLKRHISLANFCLELSIRSIFEIDPFFDEAIRAGYIRTLTERGSVPPDINIS
ncbi:hypothetical protein HY229_08635 [Candidatus Acetothermia bacterium]|nr:hypothetical protein [Candidatus Acetothermia bacterium]MBI3644147.1 hypothetical protein [Candidatus Acetothermia bacterium]